MLLLKLKKKKNVGGSIVDSIALSQKGMEMHADICTLLQHIEDGCVCLQKLHSTQKKTPVLLSFTVKVNRYALI